MYITNTQRYVQIKIIKLFSHSISLCLLYLSLFWCILSDIKFLLTNLYVRIKLKYPVANFLPYITHKKSYFVYLFISLDSCLFASFVCGGVNMHVCMFAFISRISNISLHTTWTWRRRVCVCAIYTRILCTKFALRL